MMTTTNDNVRVRFAPSPTGYLHVGGARTVLFNWLLARRADGSFILRIEDTDRTRHVEDSVAKILDDLRWLGLTWDEGPEAGGDFGPYMQSERLATYQDYAQKLLESGAAYYAMETPDELAAMREKALAEKRKISYLRPDPIPTVAEGEAARAAGKRVVVRLKAPGEDITFTDEILGSVTLPADQLEDFVIQKGDGFPTYHFACVVDDELMKISHVLRGQEHLMNTPKHIALQRALGFNKPRYAHLPVIFNIDGTKMSKRDKEKALKRGEKPPEIDVHDFRLTGYLPEALLNFLALLGWSAGEDQERFTLDELVQRFDISRVGKTNARFDREKLVAFNTDWAAQVSDSRLLEALRDYLRVNVAALARGEDDMAKAQDALTAKTIRRMNEASDDQLADVLQLAAGFRTFPDVVAKTGFFFTDAEDVMFDPKAVKKVLDKNDGAGYTMLETLLPRLESQSDWSAEAIEALLQSICAERDAKLGQVAQPLRVAITGTTVSPSIHDTLARLGRDATVARIKRCLQSRGG